MVLLLTLLSSIAHADCRKLVSQGKDSVSYQFFVDHDLREQSEKLEMAIMLVKTVMHTAGCTASEVEGVTFKSKTCKYLVPEIRNSYVCFMEATEGYYFITQDMLNNINVTYNRWD